MLGSWPLSGRDRLGRQIAKVLFRQAHLLAKRFQSRIAAKGSKFPVREGSAQPDWTQRNGAVQRFKSPVPVALGP